MYMYFCMYICSLITWEQDDRLSPNFQGGFRAPQEWFQRQKSLDRSHGEGHKIGVFLFTLRRPARHGRYSAAPAYSLLQH